MSAPSTIGKRLSWTLLTAIPAGLVIAVTSYITMDLAAAPFLGVIPLAFYLLTFVAVFRDRPWIPHALVLRILPYLLGPLVIGILSGANAYRFPVILFNLIAFALIALACHGEAYLRRPAADRLSEFYIWTSLGGMLGGVFAGLIAPNLFNNINEYPLLMIAALLLLPACSPAARVIFCAKLGWGFWRQPGCRAASFCNREIWEISQSPAVHN